ncbi:MAG: CehA/McbA family metallohydrolase [Terriglobia bacterium]
MSRKLISLFATLILVAVCLARSFASPATDDAVVVGRVLDADTGQVIPCTVAILTADQSIVTESPAFKDGFRSSGQFEKAVPPGKTTITISRGFDYVASQSKIDLKPKERRQLVVRLRRQANLLRRGWYCGDSHVHENHGPGEPPFPMDFRYVALAARAAGLDYLSIAQNWVLPSGQITAAHLGELVQRASTPDFILAWNMEAPKNYWRGDVTHCLGHCWFLGMRGSTPDGQDAIQALFQMSAGDFQSEKTPTPNFESQAFIHTLDGTVTYTHPCRWWWGDWGGQGIYPVEMGKFVSNLAQELPYDTVAGPTYDAMDILMQPWDREASLEAQGLWFMLLNKGYRMPATASTDSNFGDEGKATPGKVRVYTHVDGPGSIASFAHAMKAGRNFVTSGPLLLMQIGGHQVGDVIHLSNPADFQVSLQAWPSGEAGELLTRVELIRNGEIAKVFPTGKQSRNFSAEFNIHETGTAWYIARCFGSNDLQVAITNPIYFESKDYSPPQATPAHVTGVVSDSAGKPLEGECDVIRMVGLTPVQLSTHPFTGGRFTLEVPATARLRVRVAGYRPMMESVFMDYQPLLRLTLNMREAELADWRTFEEIKRLLGNVRLEFHLARE